MINSKQNQMPCANPHPHHCHLNFKVLLFLLVCLLLIKLHLDLFLSYHQEHRDIHVDYEQVIDKFSINHKNSRILLR